MEIKEKIKELFNKANNKKNSNNLITDDKGRLCPTQMFSEIDLARDLMVKREIEIAKNRAEELEKYQTKLIKTICDFFKESADKYKAKPLNSESGITLISIDGLDKIVLVSSKTPVANEKLLIAKLLLDEMVEKRGSKLDDFFKSLILDAFQASGTGQMRLDKIIELRNKQCNYHEWDAIKEALNDAIKWVFKRRYLNFYSRKSINDSWVKIQLNLSKN